MLVKDSDGPRTEAGNPAQKSIYETRFLIEYLDENFEGTKSLLFKQDQVVKDRYKKLLELIDANEQMIEAFSFTHCLKINLVMRAMLPFLLMKQMSHMEDLVADRQDERTKKVIKEKKEYKRAQVEPFIFDHKNTYDKVRQDVIALLSQIEVWMADGKT